MRRKLEVDVNGGGRGFTRVREKGFSSTKALKREGSGHNAPLWVDISDAVLRGRLGILKFCLVGSWKTRSNLYPSPVDLEAWARAA